MLIESSLAESGRSETCDPLIERMTLDRMVYSEWRISNACKADSMPFWVVALEIWSWVRSGSSLQDDRYYSTSKSRRQSLSVLREGRDVLISNISDMLSFHERRSYWKERSGNRNVRFSVFGNRSSLWIWSCRWQASWSLLAKVFVGEGGKKEEEENEKSSAGLGIYTPIAGKYLLQGWVQDSSFIEVFTSAKDHVFGKYWCFSFVFYVLFTYTSLAHQKGRWLADMPRSQDDWLKQKSKRGEA